MQANHSFSEFFAEIKWPMTWATIKTAIGLAIAGPLLVLGFRFIQCKELWGYSGAVVLEACAYMEQPFLYWLHAVANLPKLFAGIPPILLGILYLEWDKYKKDKPSGFGEYGRRTAPNGGWMRLNFERLVTAQAWEKYDNVLLKKICESENHLYGNFSNLEVVAMVKAASRRFTSFLRKPSIAQPECMEWHIHANSGEEVTLRLEQVAGKTQSWILTACLFEWSGRRQPVRLVQRHVTRFCLSDNVVTFGENPATST